MTGAEDYLSRRLDDKHYRDGYIAELLTRIAGLEAENQRLRARDVTTNDYSRVEVAARVEDTDEPA